MACPIARPVGIYGATTEFSCRSPRFRTGSRPGGKKAAAKSDGEYLDAALADFSGYIAADELYEGPFCVLSIVDNRTFKRLLFQVLDHDPDHPAANAALSPLPRDQRDPDRGASCRSRLCRGGDRSFGV